MKLGKEEEVTDIPAAYPRKIPIKPDLRAKEDLNQMKMMFDNLTF